MQKKWKWRRWASSRLWIFIQAFAYLSEAHWFVLFPQHRVLVFSCSIYQSSFPHYNVSWRKFLSSFYEQFADFSKTFRRLIQWKSPVQTSLLSFCICERVSPYAISDMITSSSFHLSIFIAMNVDSYFARRYRGSEYVFSFGVYWMDSSVELAI